MTTTSAGNGTNVLTECWIWNGPSTARGYPCRNRQRLHRVAYEWANGPIPEGMVIMHKCDTPLCVNPAHLEAGTYLDNWQDMLDKGRHGNARKTHCKRGHPLSGENLFVRKSGYRMCRICAAETSKRSEARRALGIIKRIFWTYRLEPYKGYPIRDIVFQTREEGRQYVRDHNLRWK